jgi:hypothetical protein
MPGAAERAQLMREVGASTHEGHSSLRATEADRRSRALLSG